MLTTMPSAPGTDRLSAVKADHQSNLSGLKDMFIGYLLSRCSFGLQCEDHVFATYNNLTSDLEAITGKEEGHE